MNFYWRVFDKESLIKEINAIKLEQEKEDFWSDSENAKKKMARLSELTKKVETSESILKKVNDLNDMIDFVYETKEELDLSSDLLEVEKVVEEYRLQSLLMGKFDSCPAIVTIHAGAGGTEAQDWADMLFRMYSMYAEKNKFKLTVLDMLDGDTAGIKSVTFKLTGEFAYGYLKCEKGVHRLVRISPFDSSARRHTSFASVLVSPEIDEVEDIVIRPEDLKVDTYRSSGAGGQHVNKTESAIRITHLPTGIVVACQNERSQIQNRETAMKMLYGKLQAKQEEENEAKLNSINGELKKIEWGSQIRSYVFCPYTMAKDHRTGYETSDINAVMNGDIQGFINDYLVKSHS